MISKQEPDANSPYYLSQKSPLVAHSTWSTPQRLRKRTANTEGLASGRAAFRLAVIVLGLCRVPWLGQWGYPQSSSRHRWSGGAAVSSAFLIGRVISVHPEKKKMPLFSKSHKNPAEIVKTLKDNMAILEKQDKKTDKASEEVSKSLQAMKEILCGTSDKEPPTEAVAQLAQELYNSGLLVTLIADLQLIDFEGKKDVTQIFNNILRRQIGTRSPTVEYISAHPHVLFMLLKGYEAPQIALRCGMMLRECIRHEPLAKIILFSNQFRDFFKYVELSTFDIASDAFATFKDLLTRHKVLVADFLEQNYDTLLGELILDRHNFAVMTRYISRPENLKLMMNLLRDKSPNIQFEAFHVFKVFVASPHKTQPIVEILLKNQPKLIEFLSTFQKERTDDEQFTDEKNYLIKQIRDLKKTAP
ncbi:calcium-binding protein 39-like isoform X2 [Loxodonta africana]|uniref:calcium-binding protein 39-like isoform X2 n=1 Tax=Loxodonta africana TaxID=9785 RepID=UPI0030CF1314